MVQTQCDFPEKNLRKDLEGWGKAATFAPAFERKAERPGPRKKTSEKICGFEKRFYLCNRKTKAEGAGGRGGDKKREIFEVLAIDEKERQESNKQDRQQKTNNGSPENKKKQSYNGEFDPGSG